MAVNKDGVYIAEDKDFQSINGFWVYKGAPLEVDITDFVSRKNLISTHYMFSGSHSYWATAVKRVVLGKNSVTGMKYMFWESQATSLDLSSFDTSNVTDMSDMFYRSQTTSVDLSSFDTSSVTNMSYMFQHSQATSLDLSSFDTSSVTNMRGMFGFSQVTSLDLSSFDTSSVTRMNYMFYSSQATAGYARTQADADKFNSSEGKPAGLVFVAQRFNKDGIYIAEDKDFQSINSYWVYKGAFLEVDITDFVNRNKLTSTNRMFSGFSTYQSTAAKRVVLGKNSVTDMSYMFNNSQATNLDLSSLDASNATDMAWMFYNSQATIGYARTQADADKFNSSEGKPAGLVFVVKRVNKDGVYIAEDRDFQSINGYWVYKGSPLEVDITDFVNRKNLTSTRNMFNGSSTYGATAVRKVVLGKNSVIEMYSMFYNSQATSLDLSSFDTSSVTDMENMFRDSQATSLDLSSFDTSNVTNIAGMFRDSQATSLDLSSFDTSSVTNMNSTFRDSQATSLDLSSFDTSNVTGMFMMFSSSQATSLDLSSFDTSSVTSMDSMFRDSQATTGCARTQADADKFNSSSNKPAGLVFVVETSFGTLDNLQIKSMSYKDSNGLIKKVQTLKYKDNLGNITKLK